MAAAPDHAIHRARIDPWIVPLPTVEELSSLAR
jgi:hypothetical protein